MFSGVKSFLLEKFWLPIIDESVYYNPYNTALYAFIFGFAALYIVYPFSKKIGISFDRDFFIGIAPYIFLGGAIRALKDLDIYQTVLLETPFIYIVMFLLTVTSYIISSETGKAFEWERYRIFSGIGVLLLLSTLSLYSFSNLEALIYFFTIVSIWLIPMFLVLKTLKPGLLSYSFTVPVASHYFDASTTVTSLAYGGVEKHVLAGFFLDSMDPAGMFVMKTLAIVPATYYIVKEMEGDERNYYLFLIALLGIALGTRNLLSLVGS